MTSFLKKIASNPSVQLFGAKTLLAFAPTLSIGNTAIFSRWSDIQDILSRDLDFLIEPINKERIERVNGSFILGLDRSETQLHERDALYQAMTHDDIPRIRDLAFKNAKELLQDIPQNGTINIVNDYARCVASRSATALMGIQGTSEDDQMRVARAMFHELFLNLGNDETVRTKAVAASEELRTWVAENIAQKRSKRKLAEDMISRMIDAGHEDDLIRRSVSGMFVGAIDTTATCVANIMAVLLKRPNLKAMVIKDLDDLRAMQGWCYDILRFQPHNPIILRHAAHDCEIGGKPIKAGTTIVCFTLAAMHDKAAFPEPSKALPDRPLTSYLHFGGGFHPCAGRAINGVQIPVLVTELLRRDPVAMGEIEYDGPFPDISLLRLQS